MNLDTRNNPDMTSQLQSIQFQDSMSPAPQRPMALVMSTAAPDLNNSNFDKSSGKMGKLPKPMLKKIPTTLESNMHTENESPKKMLKKEESKGSIV